MANQDLMPIIREIQIGIEEVKEYKVYPLSVANFMELTEIIKEFIQAFIAEEAQADSRKHDAEMFPVLLEIFGKHINKIIHMVIRNAPEDITEQMTGAQLVGLAHIVYEANYEDILKNLKTLFPNIEGEGLTDKIKEVAEGSVRQ